MNLAPPQSFVEKFQAALAFCWACSLLYDAMQFLRNAFHKPFDNLLVTNQSSKSLRMFP